MRKAGDGAESIAYETFLERVEERDDGEGDPRVRAGAVADAIVEANPHEELLAVRSQLSDEVSSPFTEGRGVR